MGHSSSEQRPLPESTERRDAEIAGAIENRLANELASRGPNTHRSDG